MNSAAQLVPVIGAHPWLPWFLQHRPKMRLLKKMVNKDLSGSMKLMPDDAEDMWHIFHLLAVGDHISATSFR